MQTRSARHRVHEYSSKQSLSIVRVRQPIVQLVLAGRLEYVWSAQPWVEFVALVAAAPTDESRAAWRKHGFLGEGSRPTGVHQVVAVARVKDSCSSSWRGAAELGVREPRRVRELCEAGATCPRALARGHLLQLRDVRALSAPVHVGTELEFAGPGKWNGWESCAIAAAIESRLPGARG